jgi:hypothetical protein
MAEATAQYVGDAPASAGELRLLRRGKGKSRKPASGAYWQRVRARMFEREGRCCYWCRIPLDPKNWTADHVIPCGIGGSRGVQNLVASCAPCNQRRGCTLGPPARKKAGLVSITKPAGLPSPSLHGRFGTNLAPLIAASLALRALYLRSLSDPSGREHGGRK